MSSYILIIGEDPALVDFSAPGVPPGMSAATVMNGVNSSKERLEAAGHGVTILLTKDAETVEAQVSRELEGSTYDVIVVGAGLRTLAPFAEQFERLMNVLHREAPDAKLAFNSRPDNSDQAALRWI
jgi:trans-aconitate methyltransferase